MKFLQAGILVLMLFAVFTGDAFAHPGRTDANGGHTCRTNCEKWGLQYGEYHYHNGGGAPAPVEEKTVVQEVVPTKAPVQIPTKAPIKKAPVVKAATPIPYKETEMDKKKMFKVVRVIDGDTIEVSIRGKNEKIRLLAIDSPETVDPRKPVQCFGKEASKKMSSLVNGKFVKLVDDRSQGNKDKYQRLLRYAYVDNTFVNAEMVKQGYAVSYKEYPTKFLNEFNKYEKEAREKQLGLWKSCK